MCVPRTTRSGKLAVINRLDRRLCRSRSREVSTGTASLRPKDGFQALFRNRLTEPRLLSRFPRH